MTVLSCNQAKGLMKLAAHGMLWRGRGLRRADERRATHHGVREEALVPEIANRSGAVPACKIHYSVAKRERAHDMRFRDIQHTRVLMTPQHMLCACWTQLHTDCWPCTLPLTAWRACSCLAPG